jgi:hypothetical protein
MQEKRFMEPVIETFVSDELVVETVFTQTLPSQNPA